jgi:hypothetical protein
VAAEAFIDYWNILYASSETRLAGLQQLSSVGLLPQDVEKQEEEPASFTTSAVLKHEEYTTIIQSP